MEVDTSIVPYLLARTREHTKHTPAHTRTRDPRRVVDVQELGFSIQSVLQRTSACVGFAYLEATAVG